MPQPGFFDLNDRHALVEKLGDPLPKLERLVNWEGFSETLAKVREKERKSNAGRKPFGKSMGPQLTHFVRRS